MKQVNGPTPLYISVAPLGSTELQQCTPAEDLPRGVEGGSRLCGETTGCPLHLHCPPWVNRQWMDQAHSAPQTHPVQQCSQPPSHYSSPAGVKWGDGLAASLINYLELRLAGTTAPSMHCSSHEHQRGALHAGACSVCKSHLISKAPRGVIRGKMQQATVWPFLGLRELGQNLPEGPRAGSGVNHQLCDPVSPLR